MSQQVLQLHDWRNSHRGHECRLRQPIMLGSYSVTNTSEGQEYAEGEGELRTLNLPADLKHVSYDLTDGYIHISDGGKLMFNPMQEVDNLFKWVSDNKEKLQSGAASGSALNTDFVTYRGVLTKIITSPSEHWEGWCIGATKYKGTIYMNDFVTEKKKQHELSYDERGNMLTYGGHRFEYYITEPSELAPNGERLDFQQNLPNQYCCVAQSQLGHHSLVYVAETDGIEKRNQVADPVLSDFIEIKTTGTVRNERMWESLVRNKMFKWWAQCYLIGIPTLVCGYRDYDLVVREIEVFKVSDLPEIGKEFWSPSEGLRFLNRFLDFVKQVVTEEDTSVMYEFSWEPESNVTFRKTAVTADRLVIPEWFINTL